MFRVVGNKTLNISRILYVEWGYTYRANLSRVISTAIVHMSDGSELAFEWGEAITLAGFLHSPQQGEMLEKHLESAYQSAVAAGRGETDEAE